MVDGELPKLEFLAEADVQQIIPLCTGPIIHNVVAAGRDLQAECTENSNTVLTKIAWQCSGKQNKREFAAPAVMNIASNGTTYTFSVFGSRRFVLTGAPNEHVVLQGMWDTARYIAKQTGTVFIPRAVSVNNIQATLYIHWPLNLDQIHRHLPESVYNLDNIDQVTYHMHNPRVALLIYPTGAIVICGARSREELLAAREKILPFLVHFIMGYTPESLIAAKRKDAALCSQLA